ncbi:MAG: PDZ domain-containing protein [Muribaculaceae bacterium]|nr:PDZ domain-containing protein [Muribaculaceae bacterium]
MKRFIVAVLAAFSFVYAMGLGNRSAQNMKKLMNAEFAISEFYVDSVNGEKLVEDAIRGMLDKLDPHSSYTTADETRELQQPLQGKFSGIGISFNMKQDTLYVISLIAGGPSERVGMLPGDRIVTVNDSVVAGVKMTTNDIRKRLMGPKGTLVNVGASR